MIFLFEIRQSVVSKRVIKKTNQMNTDGIDFDTRYSQPKEVRKVVTVQTNPSERKTFGSETTTTEKSTVVTVNGREAFNETTFKEEHHTTPQTRKII